MDDVRAAELERVPGGEWGQWKAVLGKHKWVIFTVLVAVVLGAYGTVQLILTELYEVEARLLVKLGRENTEVPPTVQKGAVLSGGVRKEELNSVIQMLGSRSLVEVVIDEIGTDALRRDAARLETTVQTLTYHLRQGTRWARQQIQSLLIALNLERRLTERERLVLGIESALMVEPVRDSDVITVKLRLPDPDAALLVLETLLNRYLDRHIEARRDVDVRDFFERQVADRRREVEALETARAQVKARWNLVSASEQRSLLLRQLDRLLADIGANQARMAELEAEQASMRARLAALPDDFQKSENIIRNPSIQSIKERLTALEQERAKRLTHYQPDSQVIANLEREIAVLKDLLAREVPTLVALRTVEANPLKRNFLEKIEEVETKIAGLASSSQQLRLEARGVREKLGEIDAGERELRTVERERALAEENYLTYSKRREEGRISEELDRRRVANVSVASGPVRPIKPVYPPKMLIVGMSLPVGLMAGVALALILEYASDVINTPRDLAGMKGVAYLGTLRV